MRFVILSLAVFLGSFGAVCAADVSVYSRDGYDRVVIEGTNTTITGETDKKITLKTGKNVTLKSLQGETVAVQSVAGKSGEFEITLSEAVTDTRHFKIGKRFIVDLFIDSSKIEVVKPAITEKPEVAVAEIKKTEPKESKPVASNEVDSADFWQEGWDAFIDKALVEVDAPQPEKLKEVAQDNIEEQSPPEMSVIETVPQLAQPTIFTLSSTTPLGVAVFERYGRLFIVSDKNKMGLPPQITGAGEALEWNIEDIPMKRGTAWKIDLPEGESAFVRPEGGGLIWRIVVSDQEPDPELESSEIQRRFDEGGKPVIDGKMTGVTKILRLNDPDYGDDLAVFTVAKTTSRMLLPYDFVDFDIIPAVIGAVVKPQTDGVRVSKTKEMITIEKKGGLNVASESQDEVARGYLKPEKAPESSQDVNVKLSSNRIYFFDNWGADIHLDDLLAHRQDLDVRLARAPKDEKIGIVFDLAKLSLSQGMGQEAMGYLNFAGQLKPQIIKSPEYIAMKGAAHLLSHQYDLASEMFVDKDLNKNTEIRLWHAASWARQDEPDKAMEIYPEKADIARGYPFSIRMQVVPPIIRAMIEQGDGKAALELVKLIDVEDKSTMTSEDYATIAYLKGRAQTIEGYPEKALVSLSTASLTDKLGPYGIRSELMLVEDALVRESIEKPEAIKRVERLRFAWRGDELENKIYQSLGRLYIDSKEPRQGLNILKRAAEGAKSIKDRRSTVRVMSEAYNTLFLGDDFDALDPVEAITIYDGFKELTPVGNEGNQIIDRLVDKLMDIGLLSRAVSVLQDKMERLEGGEHAIKTGLRIAAIQLLDRQPKATTATLSTVDDMIMEYDGDNKDDLNEKIVMLKARAFSDLERAEEALFMMEGLPDTDDVLRLRVDTAWRSGNWVAVSDNLDKLILRENLSASSPPKEMQSQMILNQAVALSLSDQYDALQRFAAQYDAVMKQSPAYKTFQMVARPSNIVTLADRETLLGLTSEVDLFNGFLESVKK